ncbi:hypothetical protein BKA56DRAFT_169270 [Ilyonectria sp. MPI-CAGE-AT-0026]|nr:hypothetical protein BKA56DRAFT_169270 [Ilyonectria sp. MPI-CAGE-AT-0026]
MAPFSGTRRQGSQAYERLCISMLLDTRLCGPGQDGTGVCSHYFCPFTAEELGKGAAQLTQDIS